MNKKNYEVQWTPDITITAGNGSVSIDTPMGNGISVSNLVHIVPRCSCCQFCPFTDGAIYTSFPAQVKCTLTNEFHFCGDTHCNVKEKVISIEWIKQWVANIKNNPRYKNEYIEDLGEISKIVYRHGKVVLPIPCVSDMLKDWENERETN